MSVKVSIDVHSGLRKVNSNKKHQHSQPQNCVLGRSKSTVQFAVQIAFLPNKKRTRDLTQVLY